MTAVKIKALVQGRHVVFLSSFNTRWNSEDFNLGPKIELSGLLRPLLLLVLGQC